MADDNGLFDEDHEDTSLPQVWVLTLADLSMLLMAFFIFLFSLASLKPEGVTETLESVRKQLKGDPSRMKPLTKPDDAAKEKALEQVNLREQLIRRERQVYEDLTAYLKGRGETSMRTSLDGARATISMPTDGMFAPGDPGQLTDLGRQRVMAVKDFLARHPDQRVHIKGFTDDVPPPPQSRFRNNWEISSLEAVAALRFLLSQGVPPTRLTSTGLADLEPLFPNTSDANRARNRRLDFVLEVQVEG
ncbi:MAG: flagellar motor protein MotB [Acidobacteriota bacterium]